MIADVNNELTYKDYIARFKFIKVLRSNDHYEHHLMRDKLQQCKILNVVIAQMQYSSIKQLVNQLNLLNQCRFLSRFIAFCLEDQKLRLLFHYPEQSYFNCLHQITIRQNPFQAIESFCVLMQQTINCILKVFQFVDNQQLVDNFDWRFHEESVIIHNQNTVNQSVQLLLMPSLIEIQDRYVQNGEDLMKFNFSEGELQVLNVQRVKLDKQIIKRNWMQILQKMGLFLLRLYVAFIASSKRIENSCKKISKEFNPYCLNQLNELQYNKPYLEECIANLHDTAHKNTNITRRMKRHAKIIFYLLFQCKSSGKQVKTYLKHIQQLNQGVKLESMKELQFHQNNHIDESLDIREENHFIVNLSSQENSFLKHHSPAMQKGIDGNVMKEVKSKIWSQCTTPIESIQYEDGSNYTGEIKNNQKHGYGVYIYKEGDTYAGQWLSNQPHGKGTYFYANGEIYEGQFKQGFMHGFGKYLYQNRNYFNGEWRQNRKHGSGQYFYAKTEDKYIGEFGDGKQHGLGRFEWKNGDIYEGNFEQNKKDGEGTAFVHQSKTTYYGKWVDDKLQKVQEISYVNGDTFKGEAWNVDGSIQGQGNYTYLDGTIYTGYFAGGKFNGFCQIVYPNGDHYKGYISDSLFQGYGEYMYFQYNLQYKGQWAKGKPLSNHSFNHFKSLVQRINH